MVPANEFFAKYKRLLVIFTVYTTIVVGLILTGVLILHIPGSDDGHKFSYEQYIELKPKTTPLPSTTAVTTEGTTKSTRPPCEPERQIQVVCEWLCFTGTDEELRIVLNATGEDREKLVKANSRFYGYVLHLTPCATRDIKEGKCDGRGKCLSKDSLTTTTEASSLETSESSPSTATTTNSPTTVELPCPMNRRFNYICNKVCFTGSDEKFAKLKNATGSEWEKLLLEHMKIIEPLGFFTSCNTSEITNGYCDGTGNCVPKGTLKPVTTSSTALTSSSIASTTSSSLTTTTEQSPSTTAYPTAQSTSSATNQSTPLSTTTAFTTTAFLNSTTATALTTTNTTLNLTSTTTAIATTAFLNSTTATALTTANTTLNLTSTTTFSSTVNETSTQNTTAATSSVNGTTTTALPSTTSVYCEPARRINSTIDECYVRCYNGPEDSLEKAKKNETFLKQNSGRLEMLPVGTPCEYHWALILWPGKCKDDGTCVK